MQFRSATRTVEKAENEPHQTWCGLFCHILILAGVTYPFCIDTTRGQRKKKAFIVGRLFAFRACAKKIKLSRNCTQKHISSQCFQISVMVASFSQMRVVTARLARSLCGSFHSMQASPLSSPLPCCTGCQPE